MADKYETIQTLLNTISGSHVSYGIKSSDDDYWIVWKVISSIPQKSHGSISPEMNRVQIDCYGVTTGSAITLGNSVKSVFDGNKTDFVGSFLDNHWLDSDPETGLYRDINEFMIW